MSDREDNSINKDKAEHPKVEKLKEMEQKERAKARIKKAGLSFPSRPEIPPELQEPNGDVKLPEDVTAIPDKKLGQYLSIFNSLASYAQCIVAIADIEKTTAENIARMAERFEIQDLPKSRRKNEDLRYGSVYLIDYVFDLRQEAIEKRADYKMAESVLQSYERAIQSLSREITRRGNEMKYQSFENNMNNRADYNGQ